MDQDRRIRFTKQTIDRLPLPDPKNGKPARVTYHDEGQDGLTIVLSSSGSRVFYTTRRIGGQVKRVRIGRYPDMPIRTARDKAAEILGAIAAGNDPTITAPKIRGQMTLRTAYDGWVEMHAKPRQRATTLAENERLFDKHLTDWHACRLSTLTRRMVVKWHAQIGEKNGKHVANRALSLLRAILNHAIAEQDWKGTNPASRIKKFPERPRERYLTPHELRRLLEALKDEQDTGARDAILVCLLTGCRKRNALRMRWAQLDLEAGLWRIPAAEMKGSRDATIRLHPYVVSLLQGRRAEQEEAEQWVFPGRRIDHETGRYRPLQDVKSAWERVREAAGLKGLRVHDLRHSYAAFSVSAGNDLRLVQEQLSHADPSITARYAHVADDPHRQAVQRTVDLMLTAGGVLEQEQVAGMVPADEENSDRADD